MIETKRRDEILSRSKPDTQWAGEPLLGGWYTQREIDAAVEAIRDSMDCSVGFGFIVPQITEFEEAFARYVGTKFAVSVSTASVGLDMAIMCLDLEPGDEVICPAVNFKASPLAILGQGGQIIFCEVDPRTFQLDPDDVEMRITPRTRAIMPVHMNGLSAPMDDLMKIAERHPHPKHGHLKVIGDAARACGGGYRGTKIGKKGWMNVFSFHTMKLMTTLGEGGMVTTDDAKVAKRLCAIRQWGGDGWGSSYKMTKVQAAVGLVQLERLDEMIAQRVARAHQRTQMLEGAEGLVLPFEPTDCQHTFYLYTLMVPPEWAGKKRDRLIKILKKSYGIACCIANRPVYLDHPFIRRQIAGQELPRSENIGTRLICPSLHPLMSESENEYIAAAVLETVDRLQRK